MRKNDKEITQVELSTARPKEINTKKVLRVWRKKGVDSMKKLCEPR